MAIKESQHVPLTLLIDLDRCMGCGACVIACAIENNVPAVTGEHAYKKSLTPMRVYSMNRESQDGKRDRAFIPVPCQHCQNDPPCVAVCPQNATQVDPRTGIVAQVPQRCMGCRYCMAACPYHARYFNWWDPVWPEGAREMLNPDVAPRTRGVVEKCNLCHGRLHVARELAAASGSDALVPPSFIPACEEACPTGAIIHGDPNDLDGRIGAEIRAGRTFKLLERLGTSPMILYASDQPWVREACTTGAAIRPGVK